MKAAKWVVFGHYTVITTMRLPPWPCNYFAADRGAKHRDEHSDEHVCMSVCPLTYLKGTCPNFTKFSIHVTRDRSLVLLWRQCTKLCTSGLVHDVTFAHNGLYGARLTERIVKVTQQGTAPERSHDVTSLELIWIGVRIIHYVHYHSQNLLTWLNASELSLFLT